MLFTLSVQLTAQTPDSIKRLKEVVVQAYPSEQSLLKTSSSAVIISRAEITKQAGNTLVPVLNSVAGIRMEERSPGSYRLSIRGSLLRSPFGIRNVKVYMDQFPLTDAGGNTYLNLIDINSLAGIEILKGPDGSLFGANSGGVVLLKTLPATSPGTKLDADLQSGSFGLFRQSARMDKKSEKLQFSISQAYQRSSGYRDNSSFSRKYVQASQRWRYRDIAELGGLVFYSDLDYQTPGGLTQAQYLQDPTSARPATAFLPGAAEQQAGIKNKTLFGGVSHQTSISSQFRHVMAFFGALTDFKNPFITNYELRDERSAGLRTYLEYTSNSRNSVNWKLNAGLEYQVNHSGIKNFGNNRGSVDTLQAADEIKTDQNFWFARFTAEIFARLNLEAAASLNYFRFNFRDDNVAGSEFNQRTFKPKIMPRIGLSYELSENASVRSTLSKGYSPPTVAEVRASDKQINTALQAEEGWNYETGIRLRDASDRFFADASVFYYRLQNAIVRRVNADDTEFFLNAGGTRQLGFESEVSGWVIQPKSSGAIRGMQLRNTITLNKFRFSNYQIGSQNYSGNKLTGVPKNVFVSSIDLQFPKAFSLYFQHNYTSEIPLNDANTVNADAYNLIRAKAKMPVILSAETQLELSVGVDNLLDEKYSLGNDLNAFGGRYYNGSAPRNYFFGVKVSL